MSQASTLPCTGGFQWLTLRSPCRHHQNHRSRLLSGHTAAACNGEVCARDCSGSACCQLALIFMSPCAGVAGHYRKRGPGAYSCGEAGAWCACSVPCRLARAQCADSSPTLLQIRKSQQQLTCMLCSSSCSRNYTCGSRPGQMPWMSGPHRLSRRRRLAGQQFLALSLCTATLLRKRHQAGWDRCLHGRGAKLRTTILQSSHCCRAATVS